LKSPDGVHNKHTFIEHQAIQVLDNILFQELHKTCKQMQSRIIDLLSQISIDDITGKYH